MLHEHKIVISEAAIRGRSHINSPIPSYPRPQSTSAAMSKKARDIWWDGSDCESLEGKGDYSLLPTLLPISLLLLPTLALCLVQVWREKRGGETVPSDPPITTASLQPVLPPPYPISPFPYYCLVSHDGSRQVNFTLFHLVAIVLWHSVCVQLTEHNYKYTNCIR